MRITRPFHRTCALTATVSLVLGLGAILTPAGIVASEDLISYGPNGSVNAIVSDGAGGAYVGGEFDAWGYQTGGLASVSSSTGAPDLTFPDVNGSILAIEPDGAGGYFLGGLFDEIGGENRENLAHIDATGNVTNWAPETAGDGINDDTDGAVFTLDLQGGVVFAGGRFLRVWDEVSDDYRQQPLAAAFDASTSGVLDWNPGFNASSSGGWFSLVNLGVWDFHVMGSTLFVCGSFDQLTLLTEDRIGVAAFDLENLDTDGGLLPWAPDPDGPVLALATSPGGKLIIGGIFENVGATTRGARMSLAEIDVITAEPTLFDVPVTTVDASDTDPGTVEAIAVTGTEIYVGGWFDEVGGLARSNLAQITDTGTVQAVQPWTPAPDFGVESIAFSGMSLYVAGSFSQIAGQSREGVAKFDSTLLDLAWNPGLDDSASTLSPSAIGAGGVIIGGRFDLVESSPALQLARVTPSGAINETFAADSSMATGYYGEAVTALSMWSGELAVARTGFDGVTDEQVDSLEWLDPTTGTTTSRLPFVPEGSITTLVAGSRLYAGGDFTSVDPPGGASAEPRTYGFGVMADGESLAAWAPAFPGPVNELHDDGTFVYAVGEGPSTGAYLGGTPFAVRAARLEDGLLDNTWSIDFSQGGTAQYGQALSITTWANGVVIGGRMLTSTSAGDDGLSLLGTSPVNGSITWQGAINGRSHVNALVPRTNSLIIGGTGSFNSSDTFAPPFGLAILDLPTPPTTRTSWQPDSPYDISAVVISGSNLFVGGRSGLLITPIPVDNPNGGGGGSPETPNVNTSTAETVTNTQTSGPDRSLTLRPGEVAAMVNGVREPATGSAGLGNKSLIVNGGGATLNIPSPTGLGQSGAPLWQPGLATSLGVDGFQPGSVTDAYLLSTPQLVGSITATATALGTNAIPITVPSSMTVGSHTLQIVGKDTRGRNLIVAVGLTVVNKPTTVGKRVYFLSGSSKLTKTAKANLKTMMNKVNVDATPDSTAKVSGVVRPTGVKASDVQLAKKRAHVVASYMKSLGFTGTINTTTAKAPARDRWSDRRVNITITL